MCTLVSSPFLNFETGNRTNQFGHRLELGKIMGSSENLILKFIIIKLNRSFEGLGQSSSINGTG